MKQFVRIILAFVFIIVLCSSAFAALPSITMLSTKTCPACKQMTKVFNELKSKHGSSVSTSHIYLEDNPEVAKEYNVRYVPMLIFKDAKGKEVAREVGFKSLSEVLAVFKKAGVNI